MHEYQKVIEVKIHIAIALLCYEKAVIYQPSTSKISFHSTLSLILLRICLEFIKYSNDIIEIL